MELTFNYKGKHLATVDFPPPLTPVEKQELEELSKKYKVTYHEGTRPVQEVMNEWVDSKLHDIYKKTNLHFKRKDLQVD